MSDTKGVLASAEVIRERVVRIVRGLGHSLRDVEFYVFGTSTKEVGGQPEDLRHGGVRNLFMSVDMDVVTAFGSRKAGVLGGRVCVEGKIEYVFDPASAPEINRRGVWVYLPPDLFEQEELS